MKTVKTQRERLLGLTGTTPCPADMEPYWERALLQVEALGTDSIRNPASFQATGCVYEDLYFQGVYGARVHAKHLIPKHSGTKRPALVLFHGYHRSASSWASLMRYACAGLEGFAMDTRGQGGMSQDVGGVLGSTVDGHVLRGLDDPDPDKLLMRCIYLDAAQLAHIAMAEPSVDGARVAAAGASMGGGIALACAALTPKLNRVVAIEPFLCDLHTTWELGMTEHAFSELDYYFRWFDPRHEREAEIFTRIGYVDNVNLAGRIQADVLMLTGLKDVCCPPETQFAVFNRMTCAKRAEIYPEYGHEIAPDMEDQEMAFLSGM